MTTHLQVLSGHSCFHEPAGRSFTADSPDPDYFVALTDTFREPVAKFEDFEGDIVRGGDAIRTLIRERNIPVEIVAANDTFQIVKRSGNER